ncbi:cysteine proteinase [Abortiporus biennis]|nr:cysteine proteinase [Abortiporus biennis]
MTRWIPLESNPEVLNTWAEKAGLVTSQDQFSDIYGFDDELLAMVPQPAKAVILLFPITDSLDENAKQEDETIATEGQHPVDKTVFWMKQTIGNACGTMALLHALANSPVTIAPESPFAKFIDECKDKTPLERAQLLETTSHFATIHEEVAASGQTMAPSAESKTNLHFTCFVQAPSPPAREDGTPVREGGMRVVELDGRRRGPVDRGQCTDFLKDVAKFVKERYVDNTTSVEFSMLALAPPPL